MKHAAVLLAASLVVPVTALPDVTGRWEGEIQDPRRPVVVTVDFTAGTASLSGAAPIAMNRLANADDVTAAFEIVLPGRMVRFVGTRTDGRVEGQAVGTETIPFWLERLPEPTPAPDRLTAWREDIDVVSTRFLRYDHSIGEPQGAAIRAHLDNLKSSVGRKADAEIVVELARAVALGGNAHTRLYLARNRTEVRRWPIRVWWFRDELRVVRAAPQHADLLGCRLADIGRSSIAAAFRRVSGIKAGNPSWQRYMSAYFLTSPDILFGAGVIRDPERVPLAFACGGTKKLVDLQPLPLRRSSSPVEAWWDLAPSDPRADPAFLPALPAERAPRYLRSTQRNYWFERVPELDAIYIQYNRAQPMPAEPMSTFIEALERAIAERPPRGLIIDVRFNTGGDSGTGTPLVETLAPRVRGLPVVVLTGRTTFSAGITHAVQWKQHAGAAVIGERVGDALDMWSEGGNLLLPHSKLTLHYANGFHTYSAREYPRFRPYFADLNVASLEPDVIVEPSWSDYVAGRDPAFEAAAARIRKDARRRR